jgi:hypothetical protein
MLAHRFLCTFAAAVACLSAVSRLAAQGSSLALATVKPGARVRVWARSRSYTGTLASRDADSIRLEVWNETWGPESQKTVMALPNDSVKVIEVSTGRTTHAAVAAVGGALGGALLGAAIGDLGNLLCGFNNSCDPNRATRGALIGAVVGGFIGLAVGSFGSENWVRAQSGSAALQVTPQPRGRLGLGLSVRF